MRKRADRWLKLSEVADLMGLKHPRQKHRVEYVRRLVRQLEQRDGTEYAKRFSDKPNAPMWIAMSVIEKLMPWDPSTVSAIRADVEEIGSRIKRAERRIDTHDRELSKHREWQKKAAELLASIS